MNQPQPYKLCDLHMKKDCPLCSVTAPVAHPNPDLNSVAPQKPTTEAVQAPVSPPTLTDPKAQKIVEAARRYAQAVEAAAIISDQVAQTKELLAALEKKLSETKQEIEVALKETKTL